MISILAILVVSLAIIITAQNATKDSEKNIEITMTKPTPTPSQAPSPTLAPTLAKDQPTDTPPTLTPTPTATVKPDPQAASDFQYPGSSVTSKTDSETAFESTDDPKKITDWYKDKIKSMHMNVTSFVQTSTNGNVLNKLVGANGDAEVRIEITKQSNSQIVKISTALSIDN